MATILEKIYASCWSCDKLTTIFKLGSRGKTGKEWLCRDCIIEVNGKTKIYYKRKKITII